MASLPCCGSAQTATNTASRLENAFSISLNTTETLASSTKYLLATLTMTTAGLHAIAVTDSCTRTAEAMSPDYGYGAKCPASTSHITAHPYLDTREELNSVCGYSFDSTWTPMVCQPGYCGFFNVVDYMYFGCCSALSTSASVTSHTDCDYYTKCYDRTKSCDLVCQSGGERIQDCTNDLWPFCKTILAISDSYTWTNFDCTSGTETMVSWYYTIPGASPPKSTKWVPVTTSASATLSSTRENVITSSSPRSTYPFTGFQSTVPPSQPMSSSATTSSARAIRSHAHDVIMPLAFMIMLCSRL